MEKKKRGGEEKKKVVSSASVHIYAAHSMRTVSVCGMGMRGNRAKERGTDTATQISTEGERGRGEEEAGSAEEGALCDA